MTTQGNGHAEYRVILVGTVKADLKRFHGELMDQGKGNAFLEVLRTVNDRLQKDPRNFGEKLYRLPALRLLVYQGVLHPLVVTYGVHNELPLVFVHVVKLLAEQGK